jgi:hypothetical protein
MPWIIRAFVVLGFITCGVWHDKVPVL